LGIGPNPQSPIPNPQSPIPNPQSPSEKIISLITKLKNKKSFNNKIKKYIL